MLDLASVIVLFEKDPAAGRGIESEAREIEVARRMGDRLDIEERVTVNHIRLRHFRIDADIKAEG